MRSVDYNTLPDIANAFSKEVTLEMFSKMCMIRYFEENVRKASDKKMIRCPIYLSIGQESIQAALSTVYKPEWKFHQHRCHGMYLAYGGNKEALIDELIHRKTGCAQGMGGSASIHDPAIGMIGHDGHMGTQVPIGIGHMFSKNYKNDRKENGLIVMGDASAEEDYVLAALPWASHKKLPILFVCEDNNLSILTEVKVRRKWETADIAGAFKMPAVDIADDPWTIMHYALEFQNNLPAYMNIRTARAIRHQGTKSDGEPEWNRFELAKERITELGLKKDALGLEGKIIEEMNKLWERRLEKEIVL